MANEEMIGALSSKSDDVGQLEAKPVPRRRAGKKLPPEPIAVPFPENAERLAARQRAMNLPHFSGKRGTKRKYQRLGLDWEGKPSYTDIKNLPPIEIDQDGYPIKPKEVAYRTRKYFTEDQRKVRFLLMYNYSGGNVTLSCQEGGITARFFKEKWGKDLEFKQLMDEQMEQVVDRALLRFNQRIGLVPAGKQLAVHDSGLFAFIKKYRPELFVAEEGKKPPEDPGDDSGSSNIPRAARPAV